MQFTGLLDKNGKEIFEGDIVKEIWPSGKGRPQKEFVWQVKWDLDYPMFVLERNGSTTGFGEKDDRMNLEVIGNIYENPELLKN